MRTTPDHYPMRAMLAAALLLAACSGGESNISAPTGTGTPPNPSVPSSGLVSETSNFSPNCAGVTNTGTLYANAEVEPHIAINPVNPNNLIATWQQDRWSNGGVRTNNGNLTNRNDVFMTPVNVPVDTTTVGISVHAEDFSAQVVSAAFEQRVHDNIVRKMEQRVPGFSRLRAVRSPPAP